jgi:hypothetical protein
MQGGQAPHLLSPALRSPSDEAGRRPIVDERRADAAYSRADPAITAAEKAPARMRRESREAPVPGRPRELLCSAPRASAGSRAVSGRCARRAKPRWLTAGRPGYARRCAQPDLRHDTRIVANGRPYRELTAWRSGWHSAARLRVTVQRTVPASSRTRALNARRPSAGGGSRPMSGSAAIAASRAACRSA